MNAARLHGHGVTTGVRVLVISAVGYGCTASGPPEESEAGLVARGLAAALQLVAEGTLCSVP